MNADETIEYVRNKLDAYDAKQAAAAPTGWMRKGWRQPDGSLAPHYGRAMSDAEAAQILRAVKSKMAAYDAAHRRQPTPAPKSTGRRWLTADELERQARQCERAGHMQAARVMRASVQRMRQAGGAGGIERATNRAAVEVR